MALGKPPRREIFSSSRHTLLKKLDKRGFSVPPIFLMTLSVLLLSQAEPKQNQLINQ